jgi:hypothetical protein
MWNLQHNLYRAPNLNYYIFHHKYMLDTHINCNNTLIDHSS